MPDPEVGSLESGVKSLESGVWSRESRVWSRESRVWSLVHHQLVKTVCHVRRTGAAAAPAPSYLSLSYRDTLTAAANSFSRRE
jgi:hypothetical protein